MALDPIRRAVLDTLIRELHVSRPMASRRLGNLYRIWKERPDPLVAPAKVVTVQGDGLTGKTAFLLGEGKSALAGADRSADGTRSCYIVYCDLDSSRKREIREIEAFLLIRNALNRAGVRTPMLDLGLKKYNELTHGGLSRFGAAGSRALSALLDRPAHAAVNVALSKAELEPIATAVIKGAVDAASRVWHERRAQEDAEREWRESLEESLTTPDLREVYSKFPSLLAKDLDAIRERVCLILDSFEVLYGLGRSDDLPSWVDMLAGKPRVFLIIAGRRVPEQFDLAKCAPLDLGPVDKGEFSRQLVGIGLGKRAASQISRLYSQVPGLGVIVARRGLEEGGLSSTSTCMSGPGRENHFEVLKLAVGEWLQEFDEKVAEQIKATAWIGGWRPGNPPSIPMLQGFAESEISNLSYVSKSDEGRYIVHALVAEAIRCLCDDGFTSEFERQILARLDEKPSDVQEVAELTGALVFLAAHRVRGCADGLRQTGILTNSPLEEVVRLADCGDILDLIGTMDYYLVSEDGRRAVDAYLGALQAYSEMELRYALLYQFVDPTFSFQRAQDAVDVCKRIVDFASSWFRRTRCRSEGEDRRTEVLLEYARRLRRFAAIATEVYKLTSDFSYQVNSMQYELEAAESIIGYVVGRGDLASPEDLTLLCNMLNALSISQYRLRRYDVSLPLREICCSLIERHPDDIEDEARARALRSGATAYLAYVRDFRTEGTCHVSEASALALPTLARDISGSLARGIVLSRKSLAIQDTWSARITVADCIFEQAVQGCGGASGGAAATYAEAIEGLEDVRKDIERKGQRGHAEYARCLQRLAFAYEAAAEAFPDEEETYLRHALDYGASAERALLKRHQSDEHVDVIKLRELKDRIGVRLGDVPVAIPKEV